MTDVRTMVFLLVVVLITLFSFKQYKGYLLALDSGTVAFFAIYMMVTYPTWIGYGLGILIAGVAVYVATCAWDKLKE